MYICILCSPSYAYMLQAEDTYHSISLMNLNLMKDDLYEYHLFLSRKYESQTFSQFLGFFVCRTIFSCFKYISAFFWKFENKI